MATIFVHVTALVSAEYAEKVAPPEHQRDFFTNIGRESGTTLQYETSYNCWQLRGDLEGISKAHRIMAAIQQLVNVPNYHCPAHAKKAQDSQADDIPTSDQVSCKGKDSQCPENLVEDGSGDPSKNISDQSYPDVAPKPEQLQMTPEKCESVEEKPEPMEFTPPKTRSRTRASLDPQVLKCESCGRKYRRKSHLLKHIQTKHSNKPKTTGSSSVTSQDSTAVTCQPQNPASSDMSKSTNHYKHITIPSMSTFMPVQSAQRNIQQTAAQRIKDKYRSRFCLQCQKSFSTYSNLERHLKIIHGGFRYRCFDCTKVFTCKDTLDRHNRIIHHNLRCLKCLHLCESEKERKRHVCANRRKERLKCEECHREYSGSLSLHKHYRVRHKDIVFSCEFCATACRSKTDLFEHYLWSHNMYKCLNCQAIFAYEAEFKEHKLTCNSADTDTSAVSLLQQNRVVSTEQTDATPAVTSLESNMMNQGSFQVPVSQMPTENQQSQDQNMGYTSEQLSQSMTPDSSASQPMMEDSAQNETLLQDIGTTQPGNHIIQKNTDITPVLHNMDQSVTCTSIQNTTATMASNDVPSSVKQELEFIKATHPQQMVSQAEPLTHSLTTFHNAEQTDSLLHMLPGMSVPDQGYQSGMADHLVLQNSMLQALTDGNALIQDHLIQAQSITLNSAQNSTMASHVMSSNLATHLINEQHQMAAPNMELGQDDAKKKGVNKMQKQRICDICNKTFSCSGNLSKHVRNIHNNKERLPCEVCSATFASQQQLNRHVRLVHNDALFNCHCNYQCGSRKELIKHQQEVHGTQVMDDCLQCEICGKAFLCEHNLKRHMKKEHDSVHCDQCKSSFMTEHLLEQHKQHVHGKPRVGCELCPKTYKTKQKLREHILSVHTAGMPFSCAKCGKRFNRQSSLSYHWQHCDGVRTGSGSEGTQGSETESLQSETSRDLQSNKVDEAFQDNLFSTALSNLTSPYSADSSYPPSATPSYTYNTNYNDMSTHAMTHTQMDLGPNPSEDNLYTLTTLTSIGELQGIKSPTPTRTPLSTQPSMTPQPSQDVGHVNEQPLINSDSQLTPLQPLPLPNKQSPTLLQPLNDMKLDITQNLVSPQNPMLPQPNSLLQTLNDQLPYSSVCQYNMPSYDTQTSMSAPLGSLLTSLIHELPPPPLPLNPTLTPLQTVNQQQMGSYTPSYTDTSISQPLTSNTTMSYAYLDSYNSNNYQQSVTQMGPPEGNTNQSTGDHEAVTKSS
ncbi:hypothetical protein LSH36_344g02035 [Paralvinella palmiformis]|uniref:C2H2-type domain-containing protein n=1 Tax=Paralvinella palmiformis TaxID=53620 RepID=A0AAD9JFH2_9ANNE|nr:hypothetical protein LSH36_344g02035 [Paralvinella palmiformis]